jgi:hypothetical protein
MPAWQAARGPRCAAPLFLAHEPDELGCGPTTVQPRTCWLVCPLATRGNAWQRAATREASCWGYCLQ